MIQSINQLHCAVLDTGLNHFIICSEPNEITSKQKSVRKKSSPSRRSGSEDETALSSSTTTTTAATATATATAATKRKEKKKRKSLHAPRTNNEPEGDVQHEEDTIVNGNSFLSNLCFLVQFP